MYAEALRRGLEQAKTVVVLTDGARYNHTIVQTHFPEAVHIVDLFHAYEHLTALAQILWGQEAKAPKAWRDLLEAGDIGRLVRKVGKHPLGADERINWMSDSWLPHTGIWRTW
jgi:transposase